MHLRSGIVKPNEITTQIWKEDQASEDESDGPPLKRRKTTRPQSKSAQKPKAKPATPKPSPGKNKGRSNGAATTKYGKAQGEAKKESEDEQEVKAKPKTLTSKKTAPKMEADDSDDLKVKAKTATSTSKKVAFKKEADESEDTKAKPKISASKKTPVKKDLEDEEKPVEESEDEEEISSEDEKPEVAAKAREKVQSTLKGSGKDPYPDWKAGDPVPYAALCTTFSKIEMTTKRLEIQAHCSLFLRQVLRLTPTDLLPTILLMINKLAADFAGVELGIGESLIMKSIGESTGRSLAVIKADQNEIGDLGLVAAKSRSNQPTMFKPKALTVRGVHEGLMAIATVEGQGSQGRKIAGIKKLLSAADAHLSGNGSKGIDITKDKGGPSEAKFIIRTLEGKLRLGLAEKTVLISLSQAMVFHEIAAKGNNIPSTEALAKGERTLKSVYR
jgi:DNA ligase-1